MITYRTFEAGDAEEIVALIAGAMPRDAVDLAWFAEYVLLEANFDPEGLLVALADGRIRGVVYAVRARVPTSAVASDAGWITIGAVQPEYRRRGIGSELLKRALEFLRRNDIRSATFAGYPPAYFSPGLDADTYPDGLRLLKRHGFAEVSRPVAMRREISDYTPSQDTTTLQATREREGFQFYPATYDDLPEVMTFASEQLAPDWGEVIRAATLRNGRADRVVVARDPAGVVAGFATYGAYRGPAERFGPFGVDPSHRGAGLGAIILQFTLQRMRLDELRSAWFLWAGEDSPAGRLYARSQFTVTRTFRVMSTDLAEA